VGGELYGAEAAGIPNIRPLSTPQRPINQAAEAISKSWFGVSRRALIAREYGDDLLAMGRYGTDRERRLT
jgi:nucleotide-binding universal stress UspA family protein